MRIRRVGSGVSGGGAVIRRPRAWWSMAVVLVAGLLGALPPAVAQEPASSEPRAAVAAPAAPQEGGEVPTGASDPLPAPRLERAYWHVFLAFGIAWALILGYAVLLNRRVGTAERDLARLLDRRR